MSIGYAALHVSGTNASDPLFEPRQLMSGKSTDCATVSLWSWISDEVSGMFACFVIGFVALWALRSPTVWLRPLSRPLRHTSSPLNSAGHPLKQRAEPVQKPLRKECTKVAETVRALPTATTAPCTAALARLPREICAEVARLLEVHDFLAVGVANVTTHQRFWSAPEVWRMLATDRSVDLAFCAVTVEPFPGEPERMRIALGSALREGFRRSIFRIDGEQLCRLGAAAPGIGGAGHAAVLHEASHMVRGLMSSDGATVLENLCELAERALQAHDPANKEGASAASQFLEVVRRRPDLLDSFQVERFESAYASALQLEEFMEVAMQRQSDQVDYTVHHSEALTPPGSSGSSPRMPLDGPVLTVDADVLDARHAVVRALVEAADGQAIPSSRPLCVERSVDAAMEAQRHCELEAMLEELRLQTEIGSSH